MPTALITGVTGQDGAYLAQHLLDSGYRVVGTYRRSSTPNTWRLDVLGVTARDDFELVEGDITDPGACLRLIERCQPDELYNLAAQSFVGVSFEQPTTTAQITGVGTLNLLEALRQINPKIRFYQASTSEMFGKVAETPQTENTPFHPRSPYGVAKLFAHWSTINYRESYGIFASCGVLFNHESPLRSREFVTRKITRAAAEIALGRQEVLELGNLDASRDWGYAKEYVQGMHAMLQHSRPDTFVLATNTTSTVRDFALAAFAATGIELRWQGEGVGEVGIDVANDVVRVRVSQRFYRPCEVDFLLGDAGHAERELGWKPTTSLAELCQLMVEADLAWAKRDFPF